MEYYRPTWAEINLDNLLHNYYSFKEHVGKNVIVMGVVKANAYGHGAVICAKELVNAGSEYLCTATADEAIQLRKADIKAPILVLGFVESSQLSELSNLDLTYTVYNLNFARILSQVGKKMNKTHKVHIKCDTGMGRLGFKGTKETVDAIKKILLLPCIEVEGIFSHFAESDAADKRYTIYQYNNFIDIIKQLEKENIKIKYKHIANSAAVIDMPQTYSQKYFNMVRPGISMYGMYPSEHVNKDSIKLKTVMSLKSQIIHLKSLSKGEYLGYGRKFQAKRNTLVATLPIGYGDGYKRILSNNSYVLINGQKADIIGTICMDQCMIDVSDFHDIQLGDNVLLFGEELPPNILAKKAGTIHHEITSCIAPRVPRVFYKEGRITAVINELLH